MAKEKVVSFVKARRDLSRIIERVGNGGAPVVIAKRQKPLAVVVGIDRFREMASASKHLVDAKGKRILKIRGIARAVGDIDAAIRTLRQSRLEALGRSL